MIIEKANIKDLNTILHIYECARKFMIENNNPTQWENKYPEKELILQHLNSNNLYVVKDNDNQIHAVFAFIIGCDSTYSYIEDGSWLSNTEYGTIHAIASDGKIHSVFDNVVNYCFKIIPHLRIDTHIDNKIMQHLILKNGFKRCGIIYVRDKKARIAYEKIN